ncbi:MAG: OmpH family outer membrane protein [Balneolaceae bacterium]
MYTCISVLTLTALWSADALQAQQKIGFIDSDLIMEKMPEYEGIEQRLELMTVSWREELQRMDREIDRLEEEFELREVLFTDEVRADRLREIEERVVQRELYLEEKFGAGGEYFQWQRELLEPIQRQIFDAMHRIAARERYDFILDRSEGVRLLYANPEWNLNDLVLTELGIESEDAGN